MNLIQQFLDENLSRDLNHQILSQLQNQNSVFEQLVSNLEDLRQRQNAQSIESKIRRIQNFIQLKKQVATSLQTLSSKGAPMLSWILDNLMDNNFLYELIKREQFLVQKQLTEMGKRIFLQDNNYQQLHEDIEFGNKLIRQLNVLSHDRNQIGKTLNREKIKEIDGAIQIFEEKIKIFQQKVAEFNTQMLLFLRKIYSFEQKIKNEFYLTFNTTQSTQTISNFIPQNQPISPETIQEPQDYSTMNNSKSHLSVNSREPQSRMNFNKTKQFTRNQQTPKKYFQAQRFNPNQTLKPQKSKLLLEKRSSKVQDRFSNYSKIREYQNKGSVLQNRRTSVDFKGRTSQGSQISYPSQILNMNKTLGTFNAYRPENNDLLYAKNEFGQPIRLPSKWASNSRSSISYYPPH